MDTNQNRNESCQFYNSRNGLRVKKFSRGSDAGGEILKMNMIFSRLINEEVI